MFSPFKIMFNQVSAHYHMLFQLEKPKQGKPKEPKVKEIDLKSYNEFFGGNSYICDFKPTSADTELWERLSKESNPKEINRFVHLQRWFGHICSFGPDKHNFPGCQVSRSCFACSFSFMFYSACFVVNVFSEELVLKFSNSYKCNVVIWYMCFVLFFTIPGVPKVSECLNSFGIDQPTITKLIPCYKETVNVEVIKI